METYRLKNIAIVILLLLNACLLFMVGQQYFQSLQTQRRSAAQLRELYRSSQLALDSRLDLSQQPLDILTLARQAETERAIAAALLGGEALATSQGGGIYSYEAHDSTIQFRAGGSFYGSRWRMPPPSPGPSAIGLVMRSLVSVWKGGPAALWPDSWPGTYPSLTAR